MEIDTQSSPSPSPSPGIPIPIPSTSTSHISDPPPDDFGTVRERRDFGPLEISLHPILPSPFRDFSFTGRTGWRYYPTAYEADRLGIASSLEGRPSTKITIPDSWNDPVTGSYYSEPMESTRRQFEQLTSSEHPKRQRTNGTEGDTIPIRHEMLHISDMNVADSLSVNPSMSAPSLGASGTISHNAASSEEVTVRTTSTHSTHATTSTTTSGTTSASTPTSLPVVDLAGPDIIPKQELYFLYGKKPRKVQLKGTDYLTWDNGKPVQDVKFTSIFVCPITKEIFLARSYGDPKTFTKEGDIFWYPKKNSAEHAAAARAVDCWNLREQRHHMKRLSIDTPYEKMDAPELPITQLPANIRDKVLEILKEQATLHETLNIHPQSQHRPFSNPHPNNEPDRGWYNNRSYYDNRRDGSSNHRGGREQWRRHNAPRHDGPYHSQNQIGSDRHHLLYARRHDDNQFDDSEFGANFGRRQMDYQNETTSQSGRWRENESIPMRRLQDRYLEDPTYHPPQTNHNFEEW